MGLDRQLIEVAITQYSLPMNSCPSANWSGEKWSVVGGARDERQTMCVCLRMCTFVKWQPWSRHDLCLLTKIRDFLQRFGRV